MSLDDAAGVVLGVLVAGRLAWARRPEAEEAVGADALAELEAAGWVVGWDQPDGAMVTLTPWAAERLGVHIDEHWEFDTVREPAGPTKPGKTVARRVAEPIPDWRGDGEPEGPIRLPRYAHEVPLDLPEMVVDERPGPEYLMDEVSEQPVLLFGQPIPREAPQRHTKGPRRAG